MYISFKKTATQNTVWSTVEDPKRLSVEDKLGCL